VYSERDEASEKPEERMYAWQDSDYGRGQRGFGALCDRIAVWLGNA